ncbi:MAG: class I SAM-dependent methyltransferase, partial [Deltaproteobacteria bacterium]
MEDHDRALQEAFDGQAARFEKAPVQQDPAALARLVAFAALPAGSRVLDAGCGPGLVSEAFLDAGHRLQGIDLSGEMVRSARARCARFADRARFEQGSLFELPEGQAFDAAVSRFVLHHAADPVAFLRAQAERVRMGGIVVASDHTTDVEPVGAEWHQEIEVARDRTHVRNLAPGEMVDALARAGLVRIGFVEEEFELDFDEWFDRGTPSMPKARVREMVESGRARGFD